MGAGFLISNSPGTSTLVSWELLEVRKGRSWIAIFQFPAGLGRPGPDTRSDASQDPTRGSGGKKFPPEIFSWPLEKNFPQEIFSRPRKIFRQGEFSWREAFPMRILSCWAEKNFWGNFFPGPRKKISPGKFFPAPKKKFPQKFFPGPRKKKFPAPENFPPGKFFPGEKIFPGGPQERAPGISESRPGPRIFDFLAPGPRNRSLYDLQERDFLAHNLIFYVAPPRIFFSGPQNVTKPFGV